MPAAASARWNSSNAAGTSPLHSARTCRRRILTIGVGMAPFFYLPHTLFVAERGLEHFDLSMRAQYELTKRFSAEGSIRTYIARDPERALAFLQTWAMDTNPHVRRLVSEGTRLRLPWAARVPWLDQNPERVLALLKDDASTMVRRSCGQQSQRPGQGAAGFVDQNGRRMARRRVSWASRTRRSDPRR